jgi:hypothetical protein
MRTEGLEKTVGAKYDILNDPSLIKTWTMCDEINGSQPQSIGLCSLLRRETDTTTVHTGERPTGLDSEDPETPTALGIHSGASRRSTGCYYLVLSVYDSFFLNLISPYFGLKIRPLISSDILCHADVRGDGGTACMYLAR